LRQKDNELIPKIFLLPICYFGPLSYYIAKKQYEHQIEIHETFQKRTIRNRAQIIGANGIQTLSVPLLKGKTQKQITDVQIAYHEDWIGNHLKTIRSAYGTAPYFDYYFPSLSSVLQKKRGLLYELFMDIEAYLVNKGFSFSPSSKTTSYTQHPNSAPTDKPLIDLRNGFKPLSIEPYEYIQVFEEKHGFIKDMSILDLLFNLGPEANAFLSQCTMTFDS